MGMPKGGKTYKEYMKWFKKNWGHAPRAPMGTNPNSNKTGKFPKEEKDEE